MSNYNKYNTVNQSPERTPKMPHLNDQSHQGSRNQIINEQNNYMPNVRLPQFIHRKNLLKSERESVNTDANTRVA